MQKKLIIYFSKLSIGGMERALIDFIKMSNLRKNYDVTLYLGYVLEPSYLEELEKYVNIHVVCKGKWNYFNKVLTYFKMQLDYWKLKCTKNKYDCSICYTHHHHILAKLTRVASDNSICFVHTDLLKSRNEQELKILKKKLAFDQFKKIICVSHCAKDAFLKIYPHYRGKVVVANNYISGETLIKKSKEKVDDYTFNKTTFVNIARHLDYHKHVSYIIEACKKLKGKYDFNVLLIGDGPDHAMYEELIKKYELEEMISLIGSRVNSYKYLVHSDAFVFSSQFEGYGFVLDEARVLNVPIITTDVADAKMIIDSGYGILCENSVDGICEGMEKFLKEGFPKKKFDYNKFNKKITKTIDEIVR